MSASSATSASKAASSRNTFRRFMQNENTPILLVLVFIVVAVFVVELIFVRQGNLAKVAFIKPFNISNVLMQISTTGILAIGMTLLMISGGIDLSIGQMMCFLGTFMAYLLRTRGFSEPAMVVTGLTVAILCELIMGLIISRTKLEPFIVSLGFMTIYTGFTYLITNGSEITITGKFTFIGQTYLNLGSFRLALPVFLLILLTFLTWLALKYTKFGRWVYAVGGNENAAYLAGINVKNFKLLLYGLMGLFVAIATMALMSRTGVGGPLMGSGKEIDVIAAVVVGGTALSGGKGNLWGTFIGVLLLGCISNALNILGVSPYWQYIMRGVLIIVAVLLSYLSGLRTSSVEVGDRKEAGAEIKGVSARAS
jgi:ribose/xylose/arabinose/galactoside ABC-type transport system permease subunit